METWRLTSPIIIASSGEQPNTSNADRKNSFEGFPTISAVTPEKQITIKIFGALEGKSPRGFSSA